MTESTEKTIEKLFETLFDNSPDGLIVVDAETQRVYIGNKMTCHMLGYSLNELRSLNIADIHPKEDLPYVMEQFEKQSKRRSSFSQDIPVKKKNGEVFYADISSFMVILDGRAYLFGYFRDVTKRRKAEETLQREREKIVKTLEQEFPKETTERRRLIEKIRETAYNLGDIPRGGCYISESYTRCVKTFIDLTSHGLDGLCLVREDPKELIKNHGLSPEGVIVLSATPIKGFQTLSSLQDISLAISDFLKAEGDIVLLDGLEYLISRFSFDLVFRTIQEKRFEFLDAGAILLIHFNMETLNSQEKALILSELKTLK